MALQHSVAEVPPTGAAPPACCALVSCAVRFCTCPSKTRYLAIPSASLASIACIRVTSSWICSNLTMLCYHDGLSHTHLYTSTRVVVAISVKVVSGLLYSFTVCSHPNFLFTLHVAGWDYVFPIARYNILNPIPSSLWSRPCKKNIIRIDVGDVYKTVLQ
eukprot:6473644-Amphidinium_carterae.1